MVFFFLQPFKNIKSTQKLTMGGLQMVLCQLLDFSILLPEVYFLFEWNSLRDFDSKKPSILTVWGRREEPSVRKMRTEESQVFLCLFSTYEESKLLVVATKHQGHCHTSMAPLYALGIHYIKSYSIWQIASCVLPLVWRNFPD